MTKWSFREPALIKIEDVSHVAFRAPDLDRMQVFLDDFGLSTWREGGRLYGRGLGDAAYLHMTEEGEAGFAGVGFRAASAADVETLARTEGVEPRPLDRPGGGVCITLRDPDGHAVEVVAGQSAAPAEALPPIEAWNSARAQPRLRRAKRTGHGAAHVVRLGHCVLAVSDFRRSEAWYKERFGFITSDEVAVTPELSIGAFLRCDRGETPTDHHTLFLLQAPTGPGFHHAAFEVADFDDLMAGHEKLAKAGWTPEWGVGRHLLGSQVFDYWRDPWGHTLEHWTDGDLFTAADGSNIASLPDLLAVQWGPASPYAP
jgi:catechol 2,3-dioxygenase-like lactoylglutathione lyase family enzyme